MKGTQWKGWNVNIKTVENEKLHVITKIILAAKAKVVWDFSFFRVKLHKSNFRSPQRDYNVQAVPGVCHQNICLN